MDREKVIKGIQECDLNGGLIGNCPYKGIIAMLKEQEQMYYTLEHDWRMCRELLKEQEAQKFFVDESGKITPLPIVFPNCPLKEYEAVVRCKDCKHQVDRGRRYKDCDKHFLQAKDDWFCADGERRTNDA